MEKEKNNNLPPQKQPRKVVVVRDFLNTTVDGASEIPTAP
jgi:hypothetical protein